MEEKNKSQIWHIAITHAFVTGLVFPLIANYIFKYIITNFDMSKFIMYSSATLLNMIAIWFGAIISAKNIQRKFTSGEVKKMIKLSVIYFILIQAVESFLYASMSADPIHFLKISSIQLVILTAVFYIASKQNIKVSEPSLDRGPAGEAKKS